MTGVENLADDAEHLLRSEIPDSIYEEGRTVEIMPRIGDGCGRFSASRDRVMQTVARFSHLLAKLWRSRFRSCVWR
jgi:hypothetical protein